MYPGAGRYSYASRRPGVGAAGRLIGRAERLPVQWHQGQGRTRRPSRPTFAPQAGHASARAFVGSRDRTGTARSEYASLNLKIIKGCRYP